MPEDVTAFDDLAVLLKKLDREPSLLVCVHSVTDSLLNLLNRVFYASGEDASRVLPLVLLRCLDRLLDNFLKACAL